MTNDRSLRVILQNYSYQMGRKELLILSNQTDVRMGKAAAIVLVIHNDRTRKFQRFPFMKPRRFLTSDIASAIYRNENFYAMSVNYSSLSKSGKTNELIVSSFDFDRTNITTLFFIGIAVRLP